MTEPAASDAAATATAEPQAPAPEPAAPTTETEGGQPTQDSQEAAPQSEQPKKASRVDARRDAIRSAREAFESQAAQEEEGGESATPDLKTSTGKDGKERIHRPDGKFASKDEIEGTAPAEGAEPAESQEAAPAEGGAQEEPERTSTVPEGFVRIELEDGHPWKRGDAFGELIVPAGQEQLARAAINQPVLRRQVEGVQDELTTLRRQNLELSTRLELINEGALPNQDPRMAALLEGIKNDPEYGELYDRLKLAVDRAPDAIVAERVESAANDVQLRETATSFLEKVQTNAPKVFPVWNEAGELHQRLASELAAYGDYVDQTGRKPDVREFFHRVNNRYSSDKRVLERIRTDLATKAQKREGELRAEIRKELEKERATAEGAAGREAQQRHKTVRGVGSLTRPGAGDRRAVEPASPQEELKKMSPSTRRRTIRKELVELGRTLQP